MIYFIGRNVLVKAWGSGFTPEHGKRLIVGALVISAGASVATFDTYDNGFWEAGGLLTIKGLTHDYYPELEAMRTQPADVEVHETNSFTDDRGYTDGVVPAGAWLDWQIFQPARKTIIDFSDANNHQIPEEGQNAAGATVTFAGGEGYVTSGSFTVVDTYTDMALPTDVTCEFRASERKINGVNTATMLSSTMSVSDSSGATITSFTGCEGAEINLEPGTYYYEYSLTASGPLALNESITTETTFSVRTYQPLLLWDSGENAGKVVDLSNGELLTAAAATGIGYSSINNPSYHVNPKSLDAKLTYAMFIPCITFGAVVVVLLRSMARGYEFEMNKCYGCDLCDDACPVRLFNGGDKLNIIYNSWNNEDDGVPLYSCLTCTACTNACPQLVNYDSYVDIRRSLIVGGPAAEIPHTVLQAVLAAEAEEASNEDFIPVEEYPISSNVGYYPGCVDYLDQEMVFSHVNEGEMNLGESTTSAFTLFEEMGHDVSYLGRDFLKCCGHDQKWQGLTEVFEKLKAYNQKKIEASGIDTLVSSCAECFRTFARDYELEGVKVMHTTEYLIESGFDMQLSTDATTVTFHDPCRLGRQMGVYDEPRELINAVQGVDLVEMEHNGEDAMCCGVSSMMSCNENARALRVARMEEIKSTGADTMLTSCPKCVSHFECLKFEGDERYEDIEILDVVTFLAREVSAKKSELPAAGKTEVEA